MHKEKHKVMRDIAQALTTPSPEVMLQRQMDKFKGYQFTGKLRPHAQTPQRRVTDPKVVLPDYAVSGIPESELRVKKSSAIEVKSPAQVEAMREACDIGRRALDLGGGMVKAGVTTDEIDTAVHEFIVQCGAYPSPLNYFNFPKSICTSVNECICHGIPDLRPLEQGEIVNLDISVYFKGMHADLNETFIVGETDKDGVRVVEGAYVSLMATIAKLKPNMMYREVGDMVQSAAAQFGLSVVTSYCGHGVGSLFHCNPNIPHYARNKAVGVMKPGHIFTIEPMLNLGTLEHCLYTRFECSF